MDLDGLLARLIELGGSDMHLKIASPAMARVDGVLTPMEERLLTESDLETVLTVVTERTPAKREHFYVAGELDTAYLAEGLGRFRVNGYRQRGAISFAFRFIPKEIPSFSRARPPRRRVGGLAEEHRGLVLVTGATGSGKSTTLAAMVNSINRSRQQHIVTIEDPIEFVHDDWGCIVNQREVGLDTESYMEALRRVLRQDPDVILIGELRDEESAKAALQAAESGHFVLSTMHTIDAAETIGRLVEFFPPAKQQMTRQILAGVLRGVVSQRLLPKKGGGRVAAVEVMVNTARIADLIRDGETDKIIEAIEDGEFHKMQSFSQHLVQLVLADQVEEEVASNAASNRHDFEMAVQQALKRRRADEKAAAAGRSRGRGARGRGDGGRLQRKRHRPPGRLDGEMRKAVAAAALLVVLAFAGGASARSFTVVPTGPRRSRARRRRTPRLDQRPLPALGAAGAAGRPLLRGAPRALAPRRGHVRRAVAGAGGDQQDRVRLRAQHGPELGRRGGVDAVHAGHVASLGHRRERRRARRSRGTPTMPSSPRPATSQPRVRTTTSPAPSSPTTTPSGTWTRCWASRPTSAPAARSTSPARRRSSGSTSCSSRSPKARRDVARAREAVPRIERRVGESTDRQLRLELKAGNPKVSTAGVPRAGGSASPTSSARRRATAGRSRPGRPISPRPSPGSSP